jgi:hypothetical protein
VKASAALLALIAVWVADAAHAEGGPTVDEISSFVAALKGTGCLLTPDTAPVVMEAAGLTEEQTSAVAQRLQDQGELTVDADRNMTLVPELCQ